MDVEDDGWGLPAERSGSCVARTPATPWSPGLGAAIVRRLARGESLSAICAPADMPNRSAVRDWARARPDFGRQMAEAAKAARLRRRRADLIRAMRAPGPGQGRPTTYTHALAAEICRRLSEGETLIAICRTEGMARYGTVLGWARKIPEFADAYAEARRIAADYLFDEAREVARAATPATIWVDRLKFDVIRWQAARIAPRKYVERVLAAEEIEALRAERAAESGQGGGFTVILKRYSDVTEEEKRRGEWGEP